MSQAKMIGFLTAVEQEFQIIKTRLGGMKVENHVNRDFYTGTIGGKHITIAKTDIGKVSAAIATTVLVTHFKCDKVIFIGTAGALCPELKVGDFVVAESVVQHDCDQRPFLEKQTIPALDLKYIKTDPALTELCEKAVIQLISDNIVSEQAKQ